MDELTIDALYEDPLGQRYQSSYWDEWGGGGGGGTTPTSRPPLTTPMPWQAALNDLRLFFDDATDAIGTFSGPSGNDQNSYYRDGSDTAPFDDMFMEMWGWLPSVQNNPAAHYWDFLTQEIDPEFTVAAFSNGGVTANFSAGSASMTPAGTDSNGNSGFIFNVNGLLMHGTWLPGSPTTGSADEIVVTGGRWIYSFIGSASVANQPNPPAAQPAPNPTSPPIDPLTIANNTLAQVNASVDFLLANHGGSYIINFKGPLNTIVSFDLAEFDAILDRYSIVDTIINYGPTTGGSGQVIQLPNGTFQTQINSTALAIYASSPAGIGYLIVHEVAHHLSTALAFTNSVFEGHLNSGGTVQSYTGTNGLDGSPELYRSESYVNNIYAAIAEALYLPIFANPGGGYNYSGEYGG